MPSSLSSQTVKTLVIDCSGAVGQATPIATTYSVAGPLNEKYEWDVISVTWSPGTTAVADAGGVTLACNKVTTGAGATTAVFAATSVVAGAMAADTPTELFRGRVSLVAGDHLNFVFATDGALTTPAVGASITVEYEVTERSGV